MNNKFIHFLLVIFLLAAGVVVYQNKQQQKVHYHAGFKVFTDNKIQDFSGFKYMKLSQCDDENSEHQVDEQLEKAHLHDGVGNVVHVHRSGAKWSDLFKNIKYDFSGNKPITGYVNGKKVANILDRQITAFDSVIIFSGEIKNLEAKLKNRITRKRIEQVEKKSESC